MSRSQAISNSSAQEVDSTYIQSAVDVEVYYYTLYQKYGIYMGIEDIYPGSRRPKTVEKNLVSESWCILEL